VVHALPLLQGRQLLLTEDLVVRRHLYRPNWNCLAFRKVKIVNEITHRRSVFFETRLHMLSTTIR